MLDLYNFKLQLRKKTYLKNTSQVTFIASFIQFDLIINTKFWITNKKMFIKKSLLVMFIASFLQLWTTNKRKTFKNEKRQKKSLSVTFIAW